MKLQDCEMTHRVVRGHPVAFVCGERALSEEEAASLKAQFVAAYGPVQVPAYVSPAGWQMLDAPSAGPLQSRFKFDEAGEEVMIDGKRVSAHLLDGFTKPTADGLWLRIVSVEGGVITVESKRESDFAPAAAAKKAKG